MPSGFSFAMISLTTSKVTGRKYTRSAIPSDVCTVAMFGLTRIVRQRTSLSALIACEPE